MNIVVMGVSGSGKTVIGKALAAALDLPFEEGDDLHPPANRAKMAAGHPLDDDDRAPWLDAIAAWLELHRSDGSVVSCSALKQSYRTRLRNADPALRFVMLDVPPALLRDRVTQRHGHFMPASLLDSQLATLERPADGEGAIAVCNDRPIDQMVAEIVERLRG